MRTTLRFVVTSAVVLCSAAGATAGCGGDDKEPVVDVTEACDRLDELAGVVLSLQSATTAQEIRNAIDAPLAAFVTAADHSGDTRLAEFAHTYDSRFSDYLAREDNEAGTDANIALDQAGARCIELGATNNFPSNS